MSTQDKADKTAPLPSIKVPAANLLNVTKITRKELSSALLTRFFSRYWDNKPGPGALSDAAVLLTPPFSGGHHIQGFRLTERDAQLLPPSSSTQAPTPDEHVAGKLEQVWDDIRERAIQAGRKQELKQEEARPEAAKRLRSSLTTSTTASACCEEDDEFAMFANLGTRGEDQGNASDVVVSAVDSDIKRYKGLKMSSREVNS